MTGRSYRADVDGLRAVAILLVVLFHATNRCPGGFVGVDVFFVISGFLITGLLLDEDRRGGIRVVDFWIRRIRRLLPAAAVVVLATLVAGSVLMVPTDYAELAKSVVAQQLLAANVFFSRRMGYFDGSSDLMPLLHTWSLAVEEQFYLVYPLLLTRLVRLPRPMMAAALLALAAASFAVSDSGARVHSQTAFYLLPARAWEILLGGLVCLAPTPRGRHAGFADALAVLGLAGVLLPAWSFDDATPFPGRAALLPCAATALLLYANSLTTTWVGRMLGTRPFVFVGLISYSLYLWHWPILSLLRYACCDARPGAAATGVAVAVSFGLAVLSWKHVEQPFRRKELLPRTNGLCVAAGASLALLLAAAVVIIATHGLPVRLGPRAAAYAAAVNRHGIRYVRCATIDEVRQRTLPTGGAAAGPVECLVWGDSHAMALMPGIDAAGRTRGVRCSVVTVPATAPLLDFGVGNKKGLGETAPAFARAVVDHAKTVRPDAVIIACNWSRHDHDPNFETCLRATLRELSDAGIRVVVVRDVASFPYSAPLKLFMATRLGADVTKVGLPVGDYAKANRRCNEIIDRLAGGNVSVLDPGPALIDEAGLWRAEYDGVAMYVDRHHLSIAGSRRLQSLFEALFDGLAAGR